MPNLTFVLIDDDELLVSGVKAILELCYEGCQVFMAYDGEAGYDLVTLHKPDLIFCN